MIVYVEYVLIDNFVIDYLLLKATYFTCGIRPKKYRLIISATFGGVIALAFPLLNAHTLILTTLKIVSGIFLVLISGKLGNVKRYIIVSAVFIGYTFLTGGAILGIYSVFNIEASSELSVALIIVPAYLVINGAVGVVRYIYRRKNVEKFTYKVMVTVGKTSCECNGFLDTGNGVYDNGNPVIFCEKQFANNFINGSLPKMKRITVNTVNGSMQKVAFEVSGLEIFNVDGGNNVLKNITICVSEAGFETGYQIILHPQLFDKDFIDENSIKNDINVQAKEYNINKRIG